MSRYGFASLVAATVTIIVLEVITWVLMPYVIAVLYFAVPALLVVWVVGGMLAGCGGVSAQIGRGMLIGSLAAPLSVVLFGGGFLLFEATGLI